MTEIPVHAIGFDRSYLVPVKPLPPLPAVERFSDILAATRTQANDAATEGLTLAERVDELVDFIHDAIDGSDQDDLDAHALFQKRLDAARNPLGALIAEIDHLRQLMYEAQDLKREVIAEIATKNPPGLSDKLEDLVEAMADLRQRINTLQSRLRQLVTEPGGGPAHSLRPDSGSIATDPEPATAAS